MSNKYVTYHFRGKDYKINVNLSDTLLELFCLVKDQCGLLDNVSLYKIITPSPFDFTKDTKISDALSQEGDFHIVTKNDFSAMKDYLNRTFPSLRQYAYTANKKVIKLYQSLNLLHKIAQSINDPKNKAEAIAVIPTGFIENCTDIEIMSKVAHYVATVYMKNLKNVTCNKCGRDQLKKKSTCLPTKKEAELGAIEVTKMKCEHCESINRIPTYLNFNAINKQKTGSYPDFCIELGSIFNSLGFNVRVVTELNCEAIWLEVYSQAKKQYVPIHPIRGDIYKGATSGAAFVYAVGAYECCDVTVRYASDIEITLEKRDSIIPELEFQQIIGMKNEQWQVKIPQEIIEKISDYQTNDIERMATPL